MTLYFIFSVTLMSLSQPSNDDSMDIETTQLPRHMSESTHDYVHPDLEPATALYPSPPGSPTSQPTVYLTSESAPGTPLRQEEVYHNLFLSPPYSPPNNPPQVVNGVPIAGFTDTADIQPPIPASNSHGGASLVGTDATRELSESLQKLYSKDDVYVIIELTKLIQANPQTFFETMKSLFPGEFEC